MPYQMPIPTRQQWQKLRDQNKVPKGAAKVSIGDDIDAVHKSWSLSTASKNETATNKLIDDVKAYLVVIKKKYPAFEAVVTRDVERKAKAHLAFVKDVNKAKKEYYPRYTAAMKAYEPFESGTAGAKAKDVAKALERMLGPVAAFALLDPVWDDKRKELNRVMSEFERATTVTPGHKKAFVDVMRSLKPVGLA